MKTIPFCAAILSSLVSATAFAQAPSWSPPPETQRCPSKWGPTTSADR